MRVMKQFTFKIEAYWMLFFGLFPVFAFVVFIIIAYLLRLLLK